MTPIQQIQPGDPISDRMRLWLADANLAVSDLDEGSPLFVASMDAAGPRAFAGLSGAGPDRLLRSVVTDPARRGTGIGRPFIAAVEAFAALHGVERLWLLTDTAAPFFEAAGYRRADREDAPVGVRTSSQFWGLCPASAVLMCKTLR